MKLTTSNGVPLTAVEPLSDGGQNAVVLTVAESEDLAIKFFLEPDEDLRSRLAAMMNHQAAKAWAYGNGERLRMTWPLELVLEEQTGDTVGYVMPLLGGNRDLFELAEPEGATGDFANFSWRRLVNACWHLASTVEGLHQQGIIAQDQRENSNCHAGVIS